MNEHYQRLVGIAPLREVEARTTVLDKAALGHLRKLRRKIAGILRGAGTHKHKQRRQQQDTQRGTQRGTQPSNECSNRETEIRHDKTEAVRNRNSAANSAANVSVHRLFCSKIQ